MIVIDPDSILLGFFIDKTLRGASVRLYFIKSFCLIAQHRGLISFFTLNFIKTAFSRPLYPLSLHV